MPYVYNPFISNLDDAGASGTGDVVGPTSTTDNAVALWDGTSGALLQDSGILVTGAGKNDISANSISLTVSLPVGDGGTGVSTLTGVLTGNGTGAVTANAITQYGVLVGGVSNAVASTAVGTATQVLTSNGAGVAPTFQAAAGGGVTSVSGTTNRVSSTGGATPVIDIDAAYVGQASITTLGTITTGVWTGTEIAVANGGTGSTTASGARTNLGLGTMATQNANAIAVTGGTLAGITNLDVILDADTNVFIDGTTNVRTVADGILRMESTAGLDNTRVINTTVDAAGFGSVAGHFVRYTATGFTATTVGSGFFSQTDTANSTGGNISAFRASSTGLGTATTTGLFATANVDPVVSLSGGEIDADSVLIYDDSGASFTDITTEAGTVGSDVSIFVQDNDVIYLGHSTTFNEITFILDTVASGGGISPTFEFSDGGSVWTSFSPTDGTNGMRFNGSITWADAIVPTWATDTVNGVASKYWIRITRTKNSLTTVPIEDLIQIVAAVEYKWDKDGAVNVNSLALTTDLTVANGGTGRSSHTAYGVLCGGTTTTAAQQSIASVGTSGQILTSNGAAALPSFQTAGGGGAWTYISTSTASSSATISFTGLSSTYFQYMVVIDNLVPATDAGDFWMRTSTDNGSSYDSGASDYNWVYGFATSTADTKLALTTLGAGNVSTEVGSAIIYIYNPSATNYTRVSGTYTYSNTANVQVANLFAGVRSSAADVDAIQFLMDTGNISTGSFKLYGLSAT